MQLMRPLNIYVIHTYLNNVAFGYRTNAFYVQLIWGLHVVLSDHLRNELWLIIVYYSPVSERH